MSPPRVTPGFAIVLCAGLLAGCASPAVGLALNLASSLAGGTAPGSHLAGAMAAPQGQEIAQSALRELDNAVRTDCTEHLPAPAVPVASSRSGRDDNEDGKCEVRYLCLSGMTTPLRGLVCEADDGKVAHSSTSAAIPPPAPWSFGNRNDVVRP